MHIFREVAQLGRVLGLGPRCRRFESCLPDGYIFMAVELSWLERPVHTREVGGSIPSAAIYFIETLDL